MPIFGHFSCHWLLINTQHPPHTHYPLPPLLARHPLTHTHTHCPLPPLLTGVWVQWKPEVAKQMEPQLNCSTPLAFPSHRVLLLEGVVQKTVKKKVRRTGRNQSRARRWDNSGWVAYLWLVKSTQRLWDEAGLSLVLGHRASQVSVG